MKIEIDTANIGSGSKGLLTKRNQILFSEKQQAEVEEAMGIIGRGRLLPSQVIREVILEVTRVTLENRKA